MADQKLDIKKQLGSLLDAAMEVGAGSLCIDPMARTRAKRMFQLRDEILAEFEALHERDDVMRRALEKIAAKTASNLPERLTHEIAHEAITKPTP